MSEPGIERPEARCLFFAEEETGIGSEVVRDYDDMRIVACEATREVVVETGTSTAKLCREHAEHCVETGEWEYAQRQQKLPMTDGGTDSTGTDREVARYECTCGASMTFPEPEWRSLRWLRRKFGYRNIGSALDDIRECCDRPDYMETRGRVGAEDDGLRADGGTPEPGTWHSGPVDPEDLEDYFEWLLEEFDGQLVESPIGGDDYYVEVTRCEEVDDDTLRSVEGARIKDGGSR